MDLDLLCLIFLFEIPDAVELSISIGVEGCMYPNPSKVVLSIIASCSLMNNSLISVSTTEAIIFSMMKQTTCKGPLDGGLLMGGFVLSVDSVLKQWYPPTLLRAFLTDKYEASLSTCKIISFA